jgi:transcriptional regulator with XRE-family HTH domain
MVSVTAARQELARLGERLRSARLARDEPMATFAQRIGVSVPTLRAMEQGLDTVAIKHWVNALWALDRLGDLAAVLEPKESVLDLARRAQAPRRQRASRRTP